MLRFLTIFALVSVGCDASGGPDFRGNPGRTAVHSNEWMGDLDEISWKVRLNSPVASPAAVWGANFYVVTTSGQLVALLSDGSEAWSAELGAPAHGIPVATALRVLVGTDRGLVAVGHDGVTQWTLETGPVEGAPLVLDSVAYAGTRDGKVIAVDAVGGSLIWEGITAGPVAASGAASGDTVVFGSGDGGVYALDRATGEPRWTWGSGAPIRGVAAAGDSVFVTGQHFVAAVDVDNPQTARWRVEVAEGVTTPPTVSGTSVLVGNGAGQLMAFGRDDGAPAFKRDTPGAIVGDIHMVGSAIVVPLGYAGVGAFNDAGEPLWTFQGDDLIRGITPLDGRLIVTDAAGSVYAIR